MAGKVWYRKEMLLILKCGKVGLLITNNTYPKIKEGNKPVDLDTR